MLIRGMLLACVVAATVAGGLVWRSRQGRWRPPSASPPTAAPAPPLAALLAELGVEPGPQATLVQFSSAFCQPCRATRGVLGRVAAMIEGVVHVEVDAESHLDAVRALHIMRTPTTLVLDPAGREVRRASGVPRVPDVVALVGAARLP